MLSLLPESVSVTRLKFAKTIKYICRFGFGSCEKPIPVCMIDINEGVESFAFWASSWPGLPPVEGDFADSLDDKPVGPAFQIKALILPSTLKFIDSGAIVIPGHRDSWCKNIILQSNPLTNDKSIVYLDKFSYFEESKSLITDKNANVNYYFTGDATNLNEFTFNHIPRSFDGNLYQPKSCPPEGIIIHKKPNAKGFEKFLKYYEDEYYTDYEDWIIPEYTVKEYTEEWWHDLAEIEEVTMTAEGMSEKTEQVGNGLSDSARKYLSHEYEKSVKSGEKFTVSSAFAPSDAYDDRTFFVSMDETVATVDTETGEVTALKKGTARIRCVAASGVFSDCILKVDGGDNTNGVQHYTEYDYGETTLPKETTTDPDLSANQTKTTDWKEFFFTNKLYIIIPVAAAAILTAAVIVIKKKKR